MRAPIIKKEDKLQYEGEILDDVEVCYYASKGDICGVGREMAKILTEPIKVVKSGVRRDIFTATVQMEG